MYGQTGLSWGWTQGLFNIRKSTSAICYINILEKSHFFPVGSEKTFDKILVPIYNLKKKNSEVATEGNTLNLTRGLTERDRRGIYKKHFPEWERCGSPCETKMLSGTTSVQRSVVVPANRQEIKGLKSGKEEINFHCTGDLIVYTGNYRRICRTV